jgi:GNAT superfamily N-acetyltransferase
MSVRNAVPSDLDEICALIGDLADYEDLAHEVVLDVDVVGAHLFGDDPKARVLIAEDGDSIAGFALWFWTFSTFIGRPGIWLEDLFVRPPFRGNGHGVALLHHLRSLTDGRVEWAVLDWNQSAWGFYRALGAEPVEGWTRFRWVE